MKKGPKGGLGKIWWGGKDSSKWQRKSLPGERNKKKKKGGQHGRGKGPWVGKIRRPPHHQKWLNPWTLNENGAWREKKKCVRKAKSSFWGVGGRIETELKRTLIVMTGKKGTRVVDCSTAEEPGRGGKKRGGPSLGSRRS